MAGVRTKKGKLLTKGRLDELVADAERGCDLSKGVREQVNGRPALGGGTGVSPRIAFRAQRETYEAAQARALAEGRSLSELGRAAMEHYLTTPTRHAQTEPVVHRQGARKRRASSARKSV